MEEPNNLDELAREMKKEQERAAKRDSGQAKAPQNGEEEKVGAEEHNDPIAQKAQELRFDQACPLGHLYLERRWQEYKKERLNIYLRFGLEAAAVLAFAVMGSFIFFRFIIPCIIFILAFIRWKRRWSKSLPRIAEKGKTLKAASWALRGSVVDSVKYSVEGQDLEMSLTAAAAYLPKARISLGPRATTVPAYCGSWSIMNWSLLAEGDRGNLNFDSKNLAEARVYHDLRRSFALVTESGVVLWFV